MYPRHRSTAAGLVTLTGLAVALSLHADPPPLPSSARPVPAPAAPPRPLGRWSADEIARRPWLGGQTPQGAFSNGERRTGVHPDPSLDAGSLEDRIAAVARSYSTWGRVDDELRWAPWLCRLPNPSVPRASAATMGGHSRKVYFLYARDRDAYAGNRSVAAQIVVKESWTHRPVDLAHAVQVHAVPLTAQIDGRMVEPDRPAGLFVMMRVDPGEARSDNGWVYGTVSAEGQVTAAGRIASCMGCHAEATHERLFGLSPRR